ncbi:hypothetical protein C8Q80DRAFT_1269066 [Daedaleopsis nitida]|nr:hypothetical protein C8Q80DRAFT_1269066 [Daedaleopsis nitida]
MNDAQFRRIQLKMIQDPKSVLAAARKGSPPDMMVLANVWNEPPAQIPYPDALSVFLTHLQLDRVRRIADAWPGIFKWSVYIFSTRIEGLERTDSRRRAAVDVLAAFWYCICFRDVVRARMVQSDATVEIASRLWLEEDDGRAGAAATAMSGRPIAAPVGTCLLGCLLREAGPEQLDRVLKMAGGKASEVAKLAISRLQRALKASDLNAEPSVVSMYLDVINSFSRVRGHALRHALLSANVIWVVSGALVRISVFVNTSRDRGWIDPMIGAFGYLRNCLESTDGFTWVAQAIGAGFLQAFCDCSSQFGVLFPEDYKMVEDLIRVVIPPYLVYRSIVEAAGSALAKIERGVQKQRVEKSRARAPWERLVALVRERMLVVKEAEASKGKQITCDNIKCQKISPKEGVRRCSACLSTFYCSKECQESAWKEGDHKMMCKLKQRSRLEGRADNVSKRDYDFLHYLAMFDARMHLSTLRELAASQFPSTPTNKLVVHIDQSVFPPSYAVKELGAFQIAARDDVSRNELARNEALVEKVQGNPERFTIVEMIVLSGEALQVLMTLATGGFWELDKERAVERRAESRLRRQDSFERALRWVFQVVDDIEHTELGQRRRRLLT